MEETKLNSYDLIMMSFVNAFRDMHYENGLFNMVALLAGGKQMEVNSGAVDFLPHLNALYILSSHGIKLGTKFQDLAVHQKEIDKLMRDIDGLRQKIDTYIEEIETAEEVQELSNIKPIAEA